MRILLATGLRLMDEAMANYIEANSPAKVEICADAVDIASRLRNGLAADFMEEHPGRAGGEKHGRNSFHRITSCL